ncbi:MAG TPA: tRNA pseudouridine(38-40) synthase TruA [Opitutaceae bacterium]
MTRWRCRCAYDGGSFSGWQSQPDRNAVQDVIEARLAAIFRRDVRIHGSGRTDAGVHARAQVFHFDAEWRHGTPKLLSALRDRLPAGLQIIAVARAGAEFHARFDATGKIYRYHLHLGDADPFMRPYCWTLFRPLDFAAMESAARHLRGRHDFRSFSAENGPRREDTVRTLRRLDLRRRGKRVEIVAEADGFLYKMVRSLVGALVAAGEGKLTLGEIDALLRGAPRTAAVQTAPPQGLFLERVIY